MSRRVWAVNEPTLIALNIDVVTVGISAVDPDTQKGCGTGPE